MAYTDVNPLDWKTIQPHIDALLNTELTTDGVDAWLKQWSDLSAILWESGARIYRRVTENTADADAERDFLTMIEEISPKLQVAEQGLKAKLLAISDYRPSAETAQLLEHFRAEAEVFREANIPLVTEMTKLEHEYEKIAGAMTIEWEGQTETLPQARLHLRDHDRATRERAWHLIMDRYAADAEQINALYMELLALRRQVAHNAGLANFRDYQWRVMGRFDYTPDDCFTFHDAIEHEVVPLATRIYTERQARLTVGRLHPWDLDVPVDGEPLQPFASAAELEEGAYRIFERVDPVLAGYYAEMRDGYLDLASRPNKAPGGYCHSLPITRKPYIFMNAVGTHDDVRTLLHEGGHAFHFMEAVEQPLVWNHHSPMEFSEVASMSMELLSAPYLGQNEGGFYTEEDARRAYADQLRDIVLFLPYMAIVDAFQHWVYTEAPEDVTPEDLDRQWATLMDRFMPGIDYTGLEAIKARGWHQKVHIFTNPFYYVEYGLAQLGALQVWRNALQDQHRAVAEYRAALALGGTRPLPQLFQAAGATFAFDRKIVRELMTLIGEQLETMQVKG